MKATFINFLLSVSSVFIAWQARSDLVEDIEEVTPAPPTGPSTQKKSGGLIDDDSQKPVKPRQPNDQVKPPTGEQDSTIITSDPAKGKSAQETRPKKSGDRRASSDAPIKFKGRDFSADKDGGVIVLEVDVVVTQDDLKINADKATLIMDKNTNEVLEVVAVGNVKFFRLDPETQQPVTADSKEAVFNNTAQTIVLKGDPRMVRGADVVKGKQITYDMGTGWIKASRVEGVVQPPKSEPKKVAPNPVEAGK